MADPLTVTDLRAHLYQVIDRVLETGQPQRVRRGDRIVVIQPEEDGRRLKLDQLPRRVAIVGTPDDLVAVSFADAWKGEL